MNTAYLLDTNILSDLIRHPTGNAARRLSRVGEDRVCTSIIVACELRFGANKSGSLRLAERVRKVLDAIDVLPIESPTDLFYAEVRHSLERRGTPIGPNDLIIAAQALSLGLVLVTHNVDEFARVERLRIENWL